MILIIVILRWSTIEFFGSSTSFWLGLLILSLVSSVNLFFVVILTIICLSLILRTSIIHTRLFWSLVFFHRAIKLFIFLIMGQWTNILEKLVHLFFFEQFINLLVQSWRLWHLSSWIFWGWFSCLTLIQWLWIIRMIFSDSLLIVHLILIVLVLFHLGLISYPLLVSTTARVKIWNLLLGSHLVWSLVATLALIKTHLIILWSLNILLGIILTPLSLMLLLRHLTLLHLWVLCLRIVHRSSSSSFKLVHHLLDLTLHRSRWHNSTVATRMILAPIHFLGRRLSILLENSWRLWLWLLSFMNFLGFLMLIESLFIPILKWMLLYLRLVGWWALWSALALSSVMMSVCERSMILSIISYWFRKDITYWDFGGRIQHRLIVW